MCNRYAVSVHVHLALRNRARAAQDFPSAFALENRAFTPPTDGSNFAEEDFKESTRYLAGATLGSPIESNGLYVIRLYVPNNFGAAVLRDLCTKLIAQFPASWAQVLADGSLLRVRSRLLPVASRVINVGAFAVSAVTVFWRREIPNEATA